MLVARKHDHRWDVSPAKAIEIQKHLAPKVVKRDDFEAISFIGGIDVGFEQKGAVTKAAVTVFSYPELERRAYSVATVPTSFPYIPGLLSFREGPAIMRALSDLEFLPGLFLFDGQGIAHPRRIGIASHIGVILDMPTIGVAKSRLTGKPQDILGDEKGSWVPLFDNDEIVGAMVRTRAGVKPVYVSTGHRVSMETAIEIVRACTTRFKLPEPIRSAHLLASN
jgi:deoxyribonuclease V